MARQKPDALTAMSLTTASPVIGMPTMTVGELAEQLSASPEEIPAVRERLRHWTREGFMFPLARHHAGSGRHRQYDQSSTYDAAILNALARAGLHIISRPYVTEMLAKAHQARQAWQSAKKRGPLFLEISHAANGGAVIAVREGTAKSVPPAELTIVIDLRQIFLACENKMAERERGAARADGGDDCRAQSRTGRVGRIARAGTGRDDRGRRYRSPREDTACSA